MILLELQNSLLKWNIDNTLDYFAKNKRRVTFLEQFFNKIHFYLKFLCKLQCFKVVCGHI